MRHFCTLFDRNYLTRGLALYESLVRHCDDFTLHVLCLDRATFDVLAALHFKYMELISIEDLERPDAELRQARRDRSLVEFYFTCKPVLLNYLFDRNPQAGRISYLDSDLYFYSDPGLVEDDLAGCSVALSPHRFSTRHIALKGRGEFNAGWLSVGADDEGRRFVQWWRARCVEWCRLVLEETRFGDQKYLDQVPLLFPNTSIVSNPGVNLAPWNIGDVSVEVSNQRVEIAGRPLIFFHFHSTRRILFNLYDSGLYEYGVKLTPAIRNGIYRPYLAELAACERKILALPNWLRSLLIEDRAPDVGTLPRQLALAARAVVRNTAVLSVA